MLVCTFTILSKYVLVSRYEVNETIGTVTLVAYRNKGTYGNVSLLFYAQNLEAQQGLDYNTSEVVSHVYLTVFEFHKDLNTTNKLSQRLVSRHII